MDVFFLVPVSLDGGLQECDEDGGKRHHLDGFGDVFQEEGQFQETGG